MGDVSAINTHVLERQLSEELIPVVASIGVDTDGQAYNVNADTVAGAIAEALGAEKLVYLTNVPGLYGDLHDEDTLISQISAPDLAAMMADGSCRRAWSRRSPPASRRCATASAGPTCWTGAFPTPCSWSALPTKVWAPW